MRTLIRDFQISLNIKFIINCYEKQLIFSIMNSREGGRKKNGLRKRAEEVGNI